MSFPSVVLVGRTNVGKSTFFNRLTNSIRSIVFDREGVTRDHQEEVISWNNISFKLTDCGGLPLGRNLNFIDQKVHDGVRKLIKTADLVLFMVDASIDLIGEDLEIANILRKENRDCIVLANKADNDKMEQAALYEFSQLGFEHIVPVSALHGRNVGDILDIIIERIPVSSSAPIEDATYSVCIVGKPNVGKSSLLNLLLQEERTIVCDMPGTTRESVTTKMKLHNQTLDLIDTAGVRRKSSVDDDLEQLMVKDSMRALKNCDIVLMVIDASQGPICDQELKLLFYAYERKKAIIVIFNKHDLVTEEHREQIENSRDLYKHIFTKVPVIWTSCISLKNIGRIKEEINDLFKRCTQPFNEAEVNQYLKDQFAKRPMFNQQKQLVVRWVQPLRGNMPAFALCVNIPALFDTTHSAFIDNLMRKKYNLLGCPVKLAYRHSKIRESEPKKVVASEEIAA